jgi:hypothetical protein
LAKEVHPTKRNVVSVAAGIYDPLGIISPTTVQLKMFAQKLCKAKIGWDDALTGVLLSSWEALVNNLQQVNVLQIPRFYLSGVDRSSIQYGLHGFSDASVGAYAAVVYLKIRTPQETVVRFIASKTRVAPVHSETIPRFELLAALLLARLISTISKALSPEMFLEPPTCYTDSQVALCWIKGQKHEWKQFSRIVSSVFGNWSQQNCGGTVQGQPSGHPFQRHEFSGTNEDTIVVKWSCLACGGFGKWCPGNYHVTGVSDGNEKHHSQCR